jgi:uncharacterized SAM-binding protein YcdF (DUF218 family)
MYSVLFWLLSNPLAVFLALMGLALGNLWRRRRERRCRLLAVTVPYLLLVLLSTPTLIYFMRGLLEWQYPQLEGRPEDIEAIVVLASALWADEEAQGGFTLDDNSRARCQRAAELYRAGKPCPMVVSGGQAAPHEPASAHLMRDFLIEHGVPATDIIVEDQSVNTYENAVECSRVLDERGLGKVALVTTGSHLVRAVRCFRKQGVETVGCGSGYLSTPANQGRLMFWPHPKALQTSRAVSYEWLALAWYWIRGRI